jgi:hypothetical protein
MVDLHIDPDKPDSHFIEAGSFAQPRSSLILATRHIYAGVLNNRYQKDVYKEENT